MIFVLVEKLYLKLRGTNGTEQIRIISQDGDYTRTLSEGWDMMTYTVPDTRVLTLYFLNDGVHRNIVLKNAADFQIWHESFGGWNCGTENENHRCKLVQEGYLAWGGKYKLTIKPIGELSKFKFACCALLNELCKDFVAIHN